MLELSKAGVPDRKAVIRLTGMDPRTVDKHWPAAVVLTAANAIVSTVLDHLVDEPSIPVDVTPCGCSRILL